MKSNFVQQSMIHSRIKKLLFSISSFDGSIVHLLLFDQALTPAEIQVLYSTFFTSEAQLTGPVPNTTPLTQDRDNCFFPGLFRCR